MLKTYFCKKKLIKKKCLSLWHFTTLALCSIASDLAHNVFIILYYAQCRVYGDAVSAKKI